MITLQKQLLSLNIPSLTARVNQAHSAHFSAVSNASTKKVLIVEDLKEFQAGLKKVAEQSGMQVVGQAYNHQQGLQLALAQRPDLILMDDDLQPGVDYSGSKLAKTLITQHGFKPEQIIFVSNAGRGSFPGFDHVRKDDFLGTKAKQVAQALRFFKDKVTDTPNTQFFIPPRTTTEQHVIDSTQSKLKILALDFEDAEYRWGMDYTNNNFDVSYLMILQGQTIPRMTQAIVNAHTYKPQFESNIDVTPQHFYQGFRQLLDKDLKITPEQFDATFIAAGKAAKKEVDTSDLATLYSYARVRQIFLGTPIPKTGNKAFDTAVDNAQDLWHKLTGVATLTPKKLNRLA